MNILFLDNYDSFSYMIIDSLISIGAKVHCEKNNICINSIDKIKFQGIVISPGPGTPQNSGICIDVIKKFRDKPILGVCLGMQAINIAFGGSLKKLMHPIHGKTSRVVQENFSSEIFNNIPKTFLATRYHSLAVDKLGENIKITSWHENIPMSLEHKFLQIYGVQFHPESFMSSDCKNIFNNFLNIVKNGNNKFTPSY